MSTRRDFIKAAVFAGASLTSACGRLRRPGGAANSDAFQNFRSRLSGRVIVPGDAEYDQARRVAWWNPATDKHPAMQVQCETDDDVARCIDFARQQDLKLAVRSGGHSNMGWGTGDGLVIDVSRMKDITLDAAQAKIRVGTGVTAEEILAASAKYGLAPVLGECGSVGAGLALGGGLGWLSGKYGATCDNVLSARLITAGVDSVSTDAASNEDLYWAIRGGGGNFGVVTSFEYRLHPIREVLAGGFAYPARDARLVIRLFRDFMSTAPDEFQALAYLTSAGGGTLMIVLVHSGDLNSGERLVSRFRSFRAPQRDWVERRLYADTYTMPPYSDEGPSCAFHAIRGSYLEHLSDEVIDVILERFRSPPPGCEFGFDLDHYMHGEVCRVAPDSTAFELRAPGAIHLAFGAEWDAPERAVTCTAWLDETWNQLQAYSGGRMYTNYMSAEGELAAKAAYGRNYSRLVSIKKRYDPDNVFRGNLNILPS
ncbi:MAG: FAD-binding oxidoreductase [Gemmatimonadaceae bacterium]